MIDLTAGADLRWLDVSACRDREVDSFFVNAGHVISVEVLALCRACPVRRECLAWGYSRGHSGYFGGGCLGQRKELSLAEALALVDAEETEAAATAAAIDRIGTLSLEAARAASAYLITPARIATATAAPRSLTSSLVKVWRHRS